MRLWCAQLPMVCPPASLLGTYGAYSAYGAYGAYGAYSAYSAYGVSPREPTRCLWDALEPTAQKLKIHVLKLRPSPPDPPRLSRLSG